MTPSLLIVGASYAGVQLAASARERGFDGRITLLGDETHLPYQRPPLSKGLLAGKSTIEQLAMRGEAFYTDNAIDLRLGARVTAIDTQARNVTLRDASRIDFDWLAIATGARCRPLTVPGHALGGVLMLRTLDDALAIVEATETARSVCVVGGGYIGLEVASALAARGLQVCVVEAQTRLLARSLPPMMSQFIAEAHQQRGVRLEFGRAVAALVGTAGQVEAVELEDGGRIACEMVIVGIGVLPNVELAEAAGIACANGVLVDAFGRTSVDHVLAAGDCAAVPNPFSITPSQAMRLESIQAANDGARAAASLLVHEPSPNMALPWFWSDQYDLKLQMTGLAEHDDEIVLRGRTDEGRFSVFYLREGRLMAAHSVSRPAEHMLSRKLIAAGVRLDAAQLADESFDLRAALLASTPAP